MINNIGSIGMNHNMNTSRKVLLIATSADKLNLKDGVEMNTGYWAEEVIEPMRVFKEAGFQVRIATPGGKKPPADPTSLNPEVVGKEKSEEYKNTIDNSREINTPEILEKLPDGELAEYSGIFIAGGHGVLGDLAISKDMARILEKALDNTYQVIGSVCHGPAVFNTLKSTSHARCLEGVRMTGFSEEEEQAAGLKGKVPFELESTLKSMGVDYHQTEELFTSYIVEHKNEDNKGSFTKFVTGQNPASSQSAAQHMVSAMNDIQSR